MNADVATCTHDTHPSIMPNDQSPKADNLKRGFFDKSIGTAAGLSKLLPTGTTMAFQTMAPTFTRGGICGKHDVINVAFTWWLIAFLTLLCAVLSFTDSVRGKDGHTYYYGIATPTRLVLFNHDDKDLDLAEDLSKKGWKWRDFLHAFFSAAVFMTVAFCDAGVQRCLVQSESPEWKQLLANLPLAVGFLASFVFIIFPSERNGIGVETAPHHTAADPTPTPAARKRNAGEAEHNAPAAAVLHLQQVQSRAVTLTRTSARPRALGVMLRRTSSHDELDSVV